MQTFPYHAAPRRYIPIDLAPVAQQVPALDLHGFQDAPAFVYRGSMYLLSFV